MKKHMIAAIGGMLLAASLSAGAQIVVRIGPPARVVETPPPPPHRGWVWQGGYHRWDGARYVWVPGTWAEPPYAHALWVPGHWSHRGGGYVWVEGHWRR
jgi:hypothetical protein